MGAVNNGADSKSVVVVGIDFSSQSRDVLQAALRITEPARSELHLIHVLPLPPGESLGASRADRELRFATQLDQARQELDRLATEAANPVRLAGHLRVGSPPVEIAQLATDVGA